MNPPPLALALLDALVEPALLIAGERTLAANAAARRLLGSELVGRNVRIAIRQPQALDAIVAARSGSVDVIGIGGIDRSWRVTIDPLDGEVLLLRLIDQSALRAGERAQVNFVANASHELRTPLSAVLGYSETLAEPGEVDQEMRRRFAGQIHRQALRMMEIIRDLMDLSRIEADRFAAPRLRVSLQAIAAESVQAASGLAAERGCHITLHGDEQLPAIFGDAAQLRQVVDNLLHNALRYGCQELGERIEVQLEQHGAWQRITVRDHGEGIAAHHLPRITERFYRVDPARSRDKGGTGLGLAIVKQVIERHRGQLNIRSRVGEGVEVEIQLPAT